MDGFCGGGVGGQLSQPQELVSLWTSTCISNTMTYNFRSQIPLEDEFGTARTSKHVFKLEKEGEEKKKEIHYNSRNDVREKTNKNNELNAEGNI